MANRYLVKDLKKKVKTPAKGPMGAQEAYEANKLLQMARQLQAKKKKAR